MTTQPWTQNDTQGSWDFYLVDYNETAVNLTSCTAVIYLRLPDQTAVMRSLSIIAPATDGHVRLATITESDVSQVGVIEMQVRVYDAGGKAMTYPNGKMPFRMQVFERITTSS